HRCIILGQDCLGKKLGQTGAESLRDAVKAGAGLVSFDGRPGDYHGAFAEIFKMSLGRAPLSCSQIKTTNVNHYLTETRELNEIISLKEAVEVWPIESACYGLAEASLLQTAGNWPVLITTTYGRGRAVLFATSAGLWTKKILGHASGMDDVFWKAIVWAARKPFAIYAMPPFATTLVDDCSGSYNHFHYVDIMNKYGWIPHLELYLEDIDRVMHDENYADSTKIKELYDAGLAEFGVHGFTYDNLMWFDHAGRKPLSDKQIAENFKMYDAYLKKWGVKPSRYENPHFSEMGRNALPYLKERGIEYLSFSQNLDTGWLDVPHKKPALIPPGPYHHTGYYMGYLKEDADFFILASKLRPWSLDSPDFTPETDFLWNNTIFWDESPFNNASAAARVGIKQIRRGVDARFFGTLLCHEQRIAVVSMREWDEMFSGIHDGLKKYRLIYRPFEYICDYARSHYDARISAVSINDESGKVHCELRGKTYLTTALEVYANEGDSVQCRLCDVPRFTGTVNVAH
ncbi:MAG: polysaccharide deacetylase family protein, partial [Kiritimatiellia bacterium]|nr:polysaccharide deacetylase family protein [Kiritimatiellia bacterium]